MQNNEPEWYSVYPNETDEGVARRKDLNVRLEEVSKEIKAIRNELKLGVDWLPQLTPTLAVIERNTKRCLDIAYKQIDKSHLRTQKKSKSFDGREVIN